MVERQGPAVVRTAPRGLMAWRMLLVVAPPVGFGVLWVWGGFTGAWDGEGTFAFFALAVVAGFVFLAVSLPSLAVLIGVRRGARWGLWVALVHDVLVGLALLPFIGWVAYSMTTESGMVGELTKQLVAASIVLTLFELEAVMVVGALRRR